MAALSGVFKADFSEFYTAVTTAEKHLVDLSAGANTAGDRLNRMVESFSGKKIVQDATLMAEAVERVGGASKLTEAELQRVAGKAAEAAEKLRAMGQDVPPKIAALAGELKGLGDHSETAGTSFGTLVKSFLTSQAIIEGAKMALHAVVELVQSMGDIAMQGAAVADVEENFRHLTSQAGLLGDQLMGALRTGTHNTITDFELMTTVNQGLAAGMSLTEAQFKTLSTGAFALAQATGGSVKDALDAMNDAMLTGRTRGVAMLTGKIDLEAAERKYAASIGTTREKLDETEKLEAARAAILDAVTAATKRLGDQTDGLDERVAQAQTAWVNFKEDLGKTIATSTVLEAGLKALGDGLVTAFGGDRQALIDAIAKAVNQAAIIVVDFGIAAIEAGRVFHAAWSAVETVVLGLETMLMADAAAIASVYAAIAQGAAMLPGVSQATKDAAVSSKAFADNLWSLVDGLKAETAEAALGVIGHSEFDQTLDKLGGVLFATRDAMVAATTSHADAVPVVKALAEETDKAGTAAEGHGTKMRAEIAAAAELKAATEAVATAMKQHWGEVEVIFDRVFGVAALKSAETWSDAIDAMGGSVERLSQDELKELEAVMLKGIDTMARNGTLTDALSSKYMALAIQARSVRDAHGEIAQAVTTATAAMLNFVQIGQGLSGGNVTAFQGPGQAGGVAPPSTFGPGQGWSAAELSQAGIPSLAQGGSGDFGSGTLAMLHGREAVIPLDRGGGGTVINIAIDARESFYDTPAGVDKLARKVGDALMAQQRAQGAVW